MWKVDRKQKESFVETPPDFGKSGGVSTDRFIIHDAAAQRLPARGAETACCPATGRVHILGRPLSTLE